MKQTLARFAQSEPLANLGLLLLGNELFEKQKPAVRRAGLLF